MTDPDVEARHAAYRAGSLRARPRGLNADQVLRWIGWHETSSGCWEWNGTKDHAGYGRVRFGGRRVRAHRLAYEAWVGPVPDHAMVRHRKCDNPPCINPAHLELGTQVDNMRDMRDHGREVKVRGEDGGRAKLTESDVRLIRELRSAGWTLQAIADLHNVSYSLIGQITRREIWRHVA